MKVAFVSYEIRKVRMASLDNTLCNACFHFVYFFFCGKILKFPCISSLIRRSLHIFEMGKPKTPKYLFYLISGMLNRKFPLWVNDILRNYSILCAQIRTIKLKWNGWIRFSRQKKKRLGNLVVVGRGKNPILAHRQVFHAYNNNAFQRSYTWLCSMSVSLASLSRIKCDVTSIQRGMRLIIHTAHASRLTHVCSSKRN